MPSATILRLEVQYRRIWRGAGHRRRFPLNDRISFGVPRGIRTLVTAVKGRCPRPTRRWGLVGRTETTLALAPASAHGFLTRDCGTGVGRICAGSRLERLQERDDIVLVVGTDRV